LDGPRPAAPGAAGHGIVLFDGTCAFCERSVKFMARRDPADYLRFGASQSESGRRILAEHGLTRELTRSIVFY
jgi:predicted DCC family thiol-disulfide oxidoreductase YuxK